VPKLPAKIMIERIYPDWLEMERELLAFKTGDQAAMLYGVLEHHQTKSYDQAVEMLDEMLNLPEVKEIEDWEKMKRINEHFRYPMRL
jgi:alpha-galactosidase/6-phospho-beta-glucosidase family protein